MLCRLGWPSSFSLSAGPFLEDTPALFAPSALGRSGTEVALALRRTAAISGRDVKAKVLRMHAARGQRCTHIEASVSSGRDANHANADVTTKE